ARGAEGRHRQDGDGGEAEREIVPARQPVASDRRRGERRDLREHVAHGDAEDLAERERADREVGTAQPEGHRADEEREQAGDGRGPDHEPSPSGHRAKRPRGRTTRTTKKMTSPTTSRYGPPSTQALTASARPSTRPPTNVPSIEPSPARTTTMSALSVNSSPI